MEFVNGKIRLIKDGMEMEIMDVGRVVLLI
jgi:hypothetical protein